MTRYRFLPLAGLLAAAPLTSQLPLPVVPSGGLRIELGGAFLPASQEFSDGSRRDLGAPLTLPAFNAQATPLVGDLERQLSAILGRAATPGSLGSIATVAEFQRGVGIIGVGVGLTRRITLSAELPIVSVRTQASITTDATGANLGFNPSLLGDGRTPQFFSQLDAAMAELATRVGNGDYAGDPEIEALAQQTLSEGPAFRAALFQLLADPGRASTVLPLLESADGTGLLSTIGNFRNRFEGQFGITGFGADPALPTTAISDAELASLLTSESGYALEPLDADPLVGIGDVSIGATVLLFQRGDRRDGAWATVWARGGVTLPTGKAPDPNRLRDQGTGDGQTDIEAVGSVDVGHGRIGIRGQISWRKQLAGNRTARIGLRDQFLLPTSLTADLRWDPGDVVAIQAQPYLRLNHRLAFTGLLQHWRKTEDSWSYSSETAAIPGVDPAIMNAGTSANATSVGLGLSYSHDGRQDDGQVRMPVESGFAVERMISSSAGLVTVAPTSRLYFRVYWPLLRR
jgi:hypothetical protein